MSFIKSCPANVLIRRLIERQGRYPLPRLDRHPTRSVT